MDEIIHELLKPTNLFWGATLVMFVLYWLVVIIGGIDLDFLDIDLHTDVHTDIHTDVHADIPHDVHGDVHGDHHHHPSLSFLHFLGVGEAPLMVVLTSLTLFMWAISFVLTATFNISSIWVCLLLWIPAFFASVFITRIFTKPIGAFFRELNKSQDKVEKIVGMSCIVTTGEITNTFGQAEVERQGASFLINARTKRNEILKRGDTALIIEHDKEADIYYVKKIDPIHT